MNEIGISNKIKYTLALSMIFLTIVLGAIYINMRKTVIESQKETRMLNLLKSLEGIQLNIQIIENNKNEFLKNGQDVFLADYQIASKKLRQENNNLVQLSIKYNFEKESILQLSNAVNKKILNYNRAVDIKNLLENNLNSISYYDSIGNSQMKFIIFEANKIQKKGIDFLQDSATERERYTRLLTWLFVVLGVLSFICIVLAYLYFKKDYSTTQKLNTILLHNSTLLKNISDAIITTNNKWIITDWNIYAEELYGYSEQEAKGKSIKQLFNIESNEPNETGENFLSSEKWKGETVHYHKNGEPINVELGKTVIKNNNGIITGSISVIRNITERVNLQKKLKLLSENLQEQVNVKVAELNFFFERIADAFIALDNDWNYTYLNKAALDLHKKPENEIIGKNIWELFPDMINEPFYEALHSAKSTQEPQRCELYYAKADKWFIDLIYPAKDGISVYYHDITDKKKAELELKKAHEKLNFHISNTPLAIMEFDSEMNILQWSKKATEIFGWTPEEVISTGFKMVETVYSDDIDIVNDAITFTNTHNTTNNIVKNRNYTKSGKVIYCEWYNSYIKDEKNNITGLLCLVKDVTSGMLTQIELINTEAKFRGMVEQSIVGVYIRKGNNLLYVNPRFAEIFGYTEAELCNNFDSLTLIADEHKYLVENSIDGYRQNKITSHHYEFKGIHKSGKSIYGEVYGTLTKYNDEDAIIGTMIDITERKKAGEQLRISDEALKFSNERFELVAKATNDGVWDWNIEKDILTGNESFCNLLAMPENGEADYEYFNEKVHPDDRERLIVNFKNAILNNVSVLTEEFRFKDKNGNYKTIFDRGYILYKNKIAYRMLGAMQDISDTKEYQKKLFLEKELSDSIINSLPGVFYLFTKEGKYFRWNKNFETVTGYDSDEIKNLHPIELFIDEEKELVASKIKNVFVAGNDMVEANFKTKSGELIPYYFTGMYIKYENEDCLMGVGLDISEKVNSQKELVESEQKFRTLVQQASDGIIVTDEDGNFKEVNESAVLLMGYSKKELDFMTTNDIFFEEGGIKRPLKFNSMVKGAVIISEHIIKRKGGKFINVEISAKQLSDGRYQRIIRDITERTQVEDALRISEKKYRLLFND
ncbi:MAG: PAS domain S-box protein, partial [Ferruginibacter sp.]|nr:PAS domain S-box protein [Ferruginibacter sp.]